MSGDTGSAPTMAAPATGASYPMRAWTRHGRGRGPRPPRPAHAGVGRVGAGLRDPCGQHLLELALVGGEAADALGQLVAGHGVLVVLPAEGGLAHRRGRIG